MGHREDLLAGARRCLETRGYARTTARDLVAESGTNLASIGYHFGSKEALLNEAIAESFQEWAERVHTLTHAHVAGPAVDPPRLLGAMWSAMLTSFTEFRGLAVAFAEAMAQVERQPELRTTLAAAYEDTRTTVSTMVVEATGMAGGPHSRTLAGLVIALFDGLLVQWLLDDRSVSTGEELTAALYDLVGVSAPVVP